MTYKICREHRETKQIFEVATSKSFCDAIWIATVFASNPGFDAHSHYVLQGKKVYFPSAKLPNTLRIDNAEVSHD
jgi:hypothetical protein